MEVMKVKNSLLRRAVTLTNHPYGAVVAEQQGAIDSMCWRNKYAFFLSNVRLPAGCKLGTLSQVKAATT